jgi:hypothetical protein
MRSIKEGKKHRSYCSVLPIRQVIAYWFCFTGAETEIRKIKDDSKIKRQTNLDRQGLRPLPNVCHLPDPPWFSVQTTFKDTGELYTHPLKNFFTDIYESVSTPFKHLYLTQVVTLFFPYFYSAHKTCLHAFLSFIWISWNCILYPLYSVQCTLQKHCKKSCYDEKT